MTATACLISKPSLLKMMGYCNRMNRREWARATIAGVTAFALPPRVRAQTAAATAGHGYRYVHLDVFTDRRLQGNQLLVFVQPGVSTSTACKR